MGCNGDIVLRISPERLEIALEQQKEGGVVARKNIFAGSPGRLYPGQPV